MKRIILYIIVLAALLVVPAERADVGKLRPVQTVALYKDANEFVIATDTGDLGRGETVQDAFHNLKATTPAIIYLDTADYLLVSEQAVDQLEFLRGKLRRSVEVYQFLGEANLEEVSKYLRVHGNGPSLKQYESGTQLPVLDCREERLKIF